MPAEGSKIVVRSWRITGADPSGAMMWFDPTRETPMLVATPYPSAREPDPFYEGGALMELSTEERVATREGGAAKTSDTD